ncbi:MAG: hypothetical protein L0I24_08345 [Pseudonocardia sp.]|nr:hypothetical protein [Pseudonocardia sp.]
MTVRSQRERRLRRVLFGLVIGALAVATAAAVLISSDDRAAATRVVTLHPDSAVTVQIGERWTLAVPVGGVSEISQLTIATVRAADFIQLGAVPLGGADLRLSSGEPMRPWTFTWRIGTPLPEDEYLYVVSETGPGPSLFRENADLTQPAGGVDVIPAVLSKDRTLATVQVHHLSAKTWFTSGTEQLAGLWEDTSEFGRAFAGTAQELAGGATHMLADALGNRGAPPECEPFARPEWVRTVVFLDDPNAPMLVCTSGTEAVPGGLVVKIVNNRGMDMRLYSPVPPAAVSLIPSGGGAVPQDVGDSILVPRRQQVDLYFGPAVTATNPPLEIYSAFTPEGFAKAMASTLTAGLLDESALTDPAGYTWNQAKNEVCGLDLAERAAGGDEADFESVLAHTECVTERGDEIVQAARGSMSQAEWQRAGPTMTRIGNIAARANAAFAALPAFTIFDRALTSGLIDAAYRISVSWQPLPGPCDGPEAFRRVARAADPTALSGESTTVAFDGTVRCVDGVAYATVRYSDLGSGAGNAFLLPEPGGYRLEVYDTAPLCSELDAAIPDALVRGMCVTEAELDPPRNRPEDNPYGCNLGPDAPGHTDPCAWRWTRDGDPGEPGDADAGGEAGYVVDAAAEIEGDGTPGQRWSACYAGYRSLCG